MERQRPSSGCSGGALLSWWKTRGCALRRFMGRILVRKVNCQFFVMKSKFNNKFGDGY